MKEAPLPSNEQERLEELHRYEVLDTSAEGDIDDLTLLAAHICHAPIALVSLVDATRQWFKSKIGIDVTETPRAVAFCAHTILGKDVLIVPDALADDRFADNPLVTGEPEIRFYAGAPLVTSNGYQLGTLCVIDRRARNVLPEEKEALQVLSRQVVHRLEYRRQLKELQRMTRARQQAEQALVASRQQLQEFLDTSNELIQRVGLDGRFLYTNQAWHDTFGYTDEDLSRLILFDIIHADSADHCRALFPRLMAGDSISMMEVSFVAKDGRRIDVVGSADCEMKEGRPVATRSVFHNVTERKAVEERLRRSEAFLSSVLEYLPNMVFIKDAKELRFVQFNKAGEELLGYQREKLLGQNDYDVFPKEQADGFIAKDRDVLTSGQLLDIPSEPIQTTNKGVRFLHTKKIPLFDAAGAPEYLLGISEDITDRKEAEEALLSLNADLEARVRARTAELERAYQQLNFHLENTPLGVIQWAPDFQLLQWSPQTERIFGWTSQEVVGKYPREWPFISEEDRPAMQKIMERLMNGQERRKVHRVRHYAKNGQEVHCVWHTSVMVGESGRVVSMMALVQDLSEQVKLERQFHQAQKMEAVGRLAGGIAHDFNNLLTVINGFSDLVVTDRETPDAIKKAVEQILYAGQQAAGLTRQLLAFSRQQVLHPQTLSLNEAVLKIDKMLRRLIGEDVRLVLDLDAHPDTIRVDPGQVEQIVMNLAVNARDAMPNGGQLCIDTATVRLEEPLVTQMAGILLPGTYVSLVLRDTGVGIDEPTLARIFEPFFTTKGPGKGTGLGLATVLGVVQQSRGAITVSSCVGKGTTVQMYFPCVAEMESITNVSSPAAGVKRGTETILLVEDEPTVRSFVHEVLSAFGYTVLEVTTAEEAMFVSNGYEQPIQLLVTDVVLPQGRGTALAKEMCRTRPGIKILLMSGYIDQSLTADNEMTAQLPFLEKPFTREVLLAKVREALES